VGQMLGVAEGGRFVTTLGAAQGDVVVQVGPVPIEGAAVLAAEAADRLIELPPRLMIEAKRATRDPGISVVDAALTAGDLGATAMHDPTEGGLAAGLHELAVAARSAIRIDGEQVRWFEPGRQVCRALGADPWATLASGSLLATFPSHMVDEVVKRLGSRGHVVAPIGVVEPGTGVFDTNGRAIPWPVRDEVARVIAGGSTRSSSTESGE
jgi:hydrogenase expression/formation protein HypE